MDSRPRFEALYAQHQPDVLAYFLRRLDREDAVEASADVFMTLWRRIDEAPDGDEARPWLFGVAHNVLRNRRRTSRRLARLIGRFGTTHRPAPQLSPEVLVVRRAEDAAVVEALERLSLGDREVLTLSLWEEASFEDVGRVVGCSRHAAEQRYARALRRFRSVWDGAGHVGVAGTERPLRGQGQTRET